jgi:hypothetical protein
VCALLVLILDYYRESKFPKSFVLPAVVVFFAGALLAVRYNRGERDALVLLRKQLQIP